MSVNSHHNNDDNGVELHRNWSLVASLWVGGDGEMFHRRMSRSNRSSGVVKDRYVSRNAPRNGGSATARH